MAAADPAEVRLRVVRELEEGSADVDQAAEQLALRKPIEEVRDPWWRRLFRALAFWRRRRAFVDTAVGRMGRDEHRQMVQFARDSGNAPLLEQLKPR